VTVGLNKRSNGGESLRVGENEMKKHERDETDQLLRSIGHSL
jgi:hypothetical protein